MRPGVGDDGPSQSGRRQTAGRQLAKFLEISYILEPAGRSFCLPHVFKTEHWGGHFAEVRRDPIRPRRIELEPRDAGHDIDATRRQTYLIEDLRFGKIADLHLCQRSTKALQCPPGSAGILLRGPNPEIDVEGGSHVAMCGQCMSTDDEVLNLLVAKSSQNLDKMRIHPVSLQ